ncbi:MAG: aminoacyl-tRNA hydrolase, partial [Spirochaeta sp.]
GFMTVDTLCSRLEGRWKKSFLRPFSYYVCHPLNVVLIKPLTYMNRSGAVLPYAIKRWSADASQILIVVDNMDLASGRLRMKPKGSSAGHNGIKSVIQFLGTGDFPRLYIGIGHPSRTASSQSVVEYVLGEPEGPEADILNHAVAAAADCCMTWIQHGTAAAMRALQNET